MFSAAEWTLYEQVAIAAMDCQQIEIAKVLFFICFELLLILPCHYKCNLGKNPNFFLC